MWRPAGAAPPGRTGGFHCFRRLDVTGIPDVPGRPYYLRGRGRRARYSPMRRPLTLALVVAFAAGTVLMLSLAAAAANEGPPPPPLA